MATLDDIRAIAEGLPGSEERATTGGIAWFVRGKLFAWECHPWPSIPDDVRAIVAAELVVGVKVADRVDALALVEMQPDVFLRTTTPWSEPKVAFRMAGVDPEHLAELVTEAWRVQAPKYLRREFDEPAAAREHSRALTGAGAPLSARRATRDNGGMSAIKTQPTDASVPDFLESATPQRRRDDGLVLAEVFREVTGAEPVMWGPSMVGYGSYRYVSPSDPKRQGDWPKTGFSPRKSQLSLYGLKDLPEAADLLPQLGTYTEGAGCVYVKKLDDIDLDVLRRLIAIAWARGDDPGA